MENSQVPDSQTPDLTALRGIAEAATEGPWELLGGNEYISPIGITVAPDDGGVYPSEADHIATFDPPTVLALLDRIEALEAERDAAISARDGWASRAGEYAAAEATIQRVAKLMERWAHLARMLAVAPGASMTPIEDVVSDLRDELNEYLGE